MARPYRDPFPTLGSYLAAVIHSAIGDQRDPRLEPAAVAGLTGDVPSAGGFLVPTEHSDGLHERMYETGSILARCAPWPAGREQLIVPLIDERSRANGSRFGGVAMNWTLPGGEITASKPKFAAREFNRRGLKGLIYFVSEMLQDVPTLEAIFSRLFALEGAFVLEREIVAGEGTQGPLGILNSDCLITVSKESGQAGGTIVAGNVVNMYARLWSASKRRAVWLVNGDITAQLYSLTWATGTGIVSLFTWSPDGTPLLMGRPVLEVEYCPTLGSKGDIILADLGEYMLSMSDIALRFSADMRLLYDESAFRFVMRVDGQSAWAGPVTPLNSATTVSPFVTLEARG